MKSTLEVHLFIFFTLFSMPSAFGAGLQVATVARVEGDVRIFSKPGAHAKNSGAEAPQVLQGDTYYNVRPASSGDTLELGNMVQSGKNGKARLIYKNGDSITVSENSIFKVRWKPETESSPVFEVLSGAIRGQFMKGGPRTNSEVKTNSVVMGVRGTDFYMARNGEGSKVSIIRGTVDLKLPQSNAKPVKLASGFSAAIAAPPMKPTVPATEAHKNSKPTQPESKTPAPPSVDLDKLIKVEKTASKDILAIQKQTIVKKTEVKTAEAKRIQDLEAKSVEVALEDIKAEDVELYKELKKSSKTLEDADKVTIIATKAIYKKTVQAEAKGKPQELNEVEDVYDRYLKD